MYHTARNLFPYAALLLVIGSLAYAVSFGTLPPADFAFNNGDEIKTVDPPKATGAPEGRIINALFEGLYRNHTEGYELDDQGNLISEPTPGPDGNVPMKLVPAMAESCDISEDGKIYTFHMRPNVQWSDGSPVTADDFFWSWRRMLHPETASRYAYQLYYISGARRYNEGTIEIGDQVEVELANRPNPTQLFPRGTIRRGVLRRIVPDQPDLPENGTESQLDEARKRWRSERIFLVEIQPEGNPGSDDDTAGQLQAFAVEPPAGGRTEVAAAPDLPEYAGSVEACRHVLPDFEATVGIRATDAATLVVTLDNRTPFFLDLVAFYPLYPVNRNCVETFGVPTWTKPEHIVCNGPFLLEFRRIRDRVRLVKNPNYWNAPTVRLNVIDALAVKSETTGLNMYLDGQLQWATTVPNAIIPELQKRDDFLVAPALITYFYRLNVNKPPLDDIHVRRALNLAMNKQLICERVTKAGQQPARSIVPPGMAGYTSPQCGPFDVAAAKAELAQSKYIREGGRLPRIEILYNTSEGHRAIAEVIQQQWKNNLGIDVELKNSEWATFLDTVHQMEYRVARAGWIGDYPDPNTFLDMWVTGGENNETGWSNARYDELIAAAQRETDPARRLEVMHEAEVILMDELPIVPIYFYVTVNMVSPDVKGFYANIQDLHPLHLLRVSP